MRYSPRSGFTLLQVVIVLAIVVILAAILFPLFERSSRSREGRRAVCQSNLVQIGLGFKQYIQDYDEKYPPLAIDAPAVPSEGSAGLNFGWANALQPYIKSTQIFQCDKEPNGANSDPTQAGYTDYWFNGRVAGKSEAVLDNQSLTVVLGDGDSHNARYGLAAIPASWRGNTSSPLYRHLDGANYAFADGHAKWFGADRWKTELDMSYGATFRLQPPVKPTN